MVTFTVAEARANFSELIKLAERGGRVTITRRGLPVVEIVAKGAGQDRKRRFGIFGDKSPVIDPNWSRPQNSVEAWLKGDV